MACWISRNGQLEAGHTKNRYFLSERSSLLKVGFSGIANAPCGMELTLCLSAIPTVWQSDPRRLTESGGRISTSISIPFALTTGDSSVIPKMLYWELQVYSAPFYRHFLTVSSAACPASSSTMLCFGNPLVSPAADWIVGMIPYFTQVCLLTRGVAGSVLWSHRAFAPAYLMRARPVRKSTQEAGTHAISWIGAFEKQIRLWRSFKSRADWTMSSE